MLSDSSFSGVIMCWFPEENIAGLWNYVGQNKIFKYKPIYQENKWRMIQLLTGLSLQLHALQTFFSLVTSYI